MPRPKIKNPRKHTIQIRLTAAEFDELEVRRQYRGEDNISDYARRVLFRPHRPTTAEIKRRIARRKP